MTTPEKLRRRQRTEGVVVILLAVFTVIQGVAFSLEDRAQQECIEGKFSELSVALDTRADLAARETAATRRVWDVYGQAAGLIKDDPTRELTKEEQDRFQRQLVAALLDYQDEVTAVQKEREENPVPPYPIGSCES